MVLKTEAARLLLYTETFNIFVIFEESMDGLDYFHAVMDKAENVFFLFSKKQASWCLKVV